MHVLISDIVIKTRCTTTMTNKCSQYFEFYFQIFVLSDSKTLSLELGVPVEFVQEKRNEIARFVV